MSANALHLVQLFNLAGIFFVLALNIWTELRWRRIDRADQARAEILRRAVDCLVLAHQHRDSPLAEFWISETKAVLAKDKGAP